MIRTLKLLALALALALAGCANSGFAVATQWIDQQAGA